MKLSLGSLRVSKPVWFGAATVVALALIITGVLLFVRFQNSISSRRSVEQLLALADRQISTGFYRAAQPYLERTMKSADTQDTWLSIVKRAYAMADATGNWSFLRRVADQGTKSLPGSQVLWTIRVLAEARGGEPSAAEQTARLHLSDRRYRSFGTEAVLRAHPDLKMRGQSLSKSDRRLIAILTSHNPMLFENLAHEIHSPDLLFDAVLLYAWKGDMKEAYSLLVSEKTAASPEAGMLISYDAGRYAAVESYYAGIEPADRSPAFELLADDILVLQQKYEKAAEAYRRFIRRNPDVFWMPYVNLAWLAIDGKTSAVSIAAAMNSLKHASRLFPGQREVVLSLASLERRTGKLQSAAALLASFLKSNPWDLDANLLSMQTSGASQNPERLKSRLWELFYRADGTGKVRIARYLAWYLLGLNDYQGLALIFTQMKRYTGSDWIPFYHGIYDALLGEYSDSIDEFKKAYSVVPRWQTLYNLGIVQLKREDPTAALNDLQKADSTLTGDNETLIKSPRRAQIHVALADTLSRLGNTEAAKREALYAQDMDPNNLSAALLLKKLDSSVQK